MWRTLLLSGIAVGLLTGAAVAEGRGRFDPANPLPPRSISGPIVPGPWMPLQPMATAPSGYSGSMNADTW